MYILTHISSFDHRVTWACIDYINVSMFYQVLFFDWWCVLKGCFIKASKFNLGILLKPLQPVNEDYIQSLILFDITWMSFCQHNMFWLYLGMSTATQPISLQVWYCQSQLIKQFDMTILTIYCKEQMRCAHMVNIMSPGDSIFFLAIATANFHIKDPLRGILKFVKLHLKNLGSMNIHIECANVSVTCACPPLLPGLGNSSAVKMATTQGNIGIIQTYMFEPEAGSDSQEETTA